MPVVDVKNLEGKKAGQVELADDVFAAEVNEHLLHEASRHYLAGLRAGTHKTKDKSEVSGSGRKLWKQKGTGRARIGSIRSPLWRKGGTVHGPKPRDYSYRLPKKMILGALRSALSAKLAEGKLTVVDSWSLESHKTKPFRQALTKLDEASRTILVVAESDANTNLERASRNLEGVMTVPTIGLETYDVLRHEHLMLSKLAAQKLSRALTSQAIGPEPVQIEAAPAPAAKKTHAAHAAVPAEKKEKKPAKKPAKKNAAHAAKSKSGKKKD
ncbi:MAG: 50S ribosomal protein L4 [Candidatus Acidiferrales bacterium]